MGGKRNILRCSVLSWSPSTELPFLQENENLTFAQNSAVIMSHFLHQEFIFQHTATTVSHFNS